MDLLKYTVLDDTTHVIGPGEYTVCGVVIPVASTWSTDEPKKLCGKCKTRAEDTDEFGVARKEADAVNPTPLAPEETPALEPEPDPAPKASKVTVATPTTKATKSGNKG